MIEFCKDTRIYAYIMPFSSGIGLQAPPGLISGVCRELQGSGDMNGIPARDEDIPGYRDGAHWSQVCMITLVHWHSLYRSNLVFTEVKKVAGMYL